jgi:hypothetical protein
MHRVKALAGIGIFTAGLACAQTLYVPGPRTLGVYMDFDSTPGKSSLAIMKDEVDSLLDSAGVKVNWRMIQENRGNETYSRLVVLKFTGACKVDGLVAMTRGDEAAEAKVGDTMVVNGRVLPYSEVKCDVVRRALSFLSPKASKEQKQEALGIALGRVVAHELYHVLAHTTSHAQRGLAKASQPLKDLISKKSLTFQDRDAEAIRKGFEAPTN